MVVVLSSLVVCAASSWAQMLVDEAPLVALHTLLKDMASPTLVYRSPIDCPLQVEAVDVSKKAATFAVFGSEMELVVFDGDATEYDVLPLNHRDVVRLQATSHTLSVKLEGDYNLHAAASSFLLRCTSVVEEEPPIEILF
jgi:hypothetical protein